MPAPAAPRNGEGALRQVAYASPVPVNDFIHHQFYRICPPECLLVCAPFPLEAFTPECAEAARPGFWSAFDFLAGRGVERISQIGIPWSALLGRKTVLELLAEARRRTDIAVAADFEESIHALRQLGVRNVAVAAKWDDALMQRVGDYLADAGLAMVGCVSEAHSAQQVIGVGPGAGVALAERLGDEALSRHPSADGLLLAGGAWSSLSVIPRLEARYGKPVVTNPVASCWMILRQLGLPPRAAGLGRLLDSLLPADTRRRS